MTTTYRQLHGRGGAFWGLLAGLAAIATAGLAAALYMEHQGHWVTGMDNQIVWGLPHVFAIFLIIAASGALNTASVGTVFGVSAYKPLGRLSGLLAIALLAGGLAVLVLDLGRPDRLIVAMTNYNFRSIFAWNIFLYSGFMGLTAVYLWTLMERRANRWSKPAGIAALIWRLTLTTGTGLIFGFLVAREAYDAALLAPLFIAMSLAFGLAVFIPVTMICCAPLGDGPVRRLGRLLGVFVAAVLYFTVVQHLVKYNAVASAGVERFILFEGGAISALFWIGQVGLGEILPLALLFGSASRGRVLTAAGLVILGGFAQLYVIIIGGQAYPLDLFPGMEITSSFFDGEISVYRPSLAEFGLGLGGCAVAAMIALIGLRILPFLPDTLTELETSP